MKHLPGILIAVAALLAAGPASRAQNSFPGHSWSLVEAETVAGQSLFQSHCASCHVPRPDGRILAPSLIGVVGRRAGSVPGFPYSAALKKSGLTWTEENLRKWISDNEHMVQGTLMPHVSIKDPAETIYITAYLKTLKQKP